MTSSSVFYEWDVEEVTDCETPENEEGEVMEHWHQESYADCLDHVARGVNAGMRYEVVLVCNDPECRSWAYMDGNKLPEYFEDAYQHSTRRVPQRFHKEVAARHG